MNTSLVAVQREMLRILKEHSTYTDSTFHSYNISGHNSKIINLIQVCYASSLVLQAQAEVSAFTNLQSSAPTDADSGDIT